ncbi:MAG: YitT family protein [Erysipelotrichaceae bacterium]|nr:YitT family protein [Erysipelotrichaceae bacterium]
MKNVKTITGILIGNFILALGVTMFVVPFGLISGGATGVSLIMQHYFNIPLTVTISFLNIAMLVIGFIFLGQKFASTTLLSTFIYPIFLDFCLSFDILEQISDNMLLSSIFAGVFIGAGVGLVLKMGANTSGMDIPSIILSRKFKWNLSIVMYSIDTVLLLIQITFSKPSDVLYGLIVVLTTSLSVNQMLIFGNSKIESFVISYEYLQIKDLILRQMDLGATLIPIETGLEIIQKKGILYILSSRDISKVKQKILEIDPQAFMTIHTIKEVHGRGYTISR